MSDKPKGVLTRSELLAELQADRIFKSGTWTSGCVRLVGYDLRMATDLIVVPGDGDGAKTRYYKAGEHRQSIVILRPGQSAFVSSAEQFCVPRDVVGQIGQKFALVSQGILTLTGLLVDPGYGLSATGADGQARLHFLLANVGPRSVALQPGVTTIATLLFTRLDEEQPLQEVHSVGFRQIDDAFLSESDGAGIAIFQHMTALGDRIDEMAGDMRGYGQRLLGIESGSNQIVMFGLYLVCVTVLGASLATLLAIASNSDATSAIARAGEQLAPSWPILIVFALAVVGLGFLANHVLKWIVRSRKSPTPPA